MVLTVFIRWGCSFQFFYADGLYKRRKLGDGGKIEFFQLFFTTKPAGQDTGLGLSLAYDIITKGHGGELKVETKEGEYTEFVVQLPG